MSEPLDLPAVTHRLGMLEERQRTAPGHDHLNSLRAEVPRMIQDSEERLINRTERLYEKYQQETLKGMDQAFNLAQRETQRMLKDMFAEREQKSKSWMTPQTVIIGGIGLLIGLAPEYIVPAILRWGGG